MLFASALNLLTKMQYLDSILHNVMTAHAKIYTHLNKLMLQQSELLPKLHECIQFDHLPIIVGSHKQSLSAKGC